jgi:hypothetical protein
MTIGRYTNEWKKHDMNFVDSFALLSGELIFVHNTVT